MSITGRGGSKIKELQETSGSRIKVTVADKMPALITWTLSLLPAMCIVCSGYTATSRCWAPRCSPLSLVVSTGTLPLPVSRVRRESPLLSPPLKQIGFVTSVFHCECSRSLSQCTSFQSWISALMAFTELYRRHQWAIGFLHHLGLPYL